MVDRGLAGAGLALAILAGLGGVAGWTASSELIGTPEAPVHGAALLVSIAIVPWLLLATRRTFLLLLRRRGMPLLGRLVPAGLVRATTSFAGPEGEPALATAVGRRVAAVLAEGSGRRLANAGTGVFWSAFAAAAILAIWLATARVALGFGWESSWLPPGLGQAITELAASPLAPIIGTEELRPVAPPPTAPADDLEALAARRTWIHFLTAGIAIYLLLPMLLWTAVNAAIGHVQAERWRPHTPPSPTDRTRPRVDAFADPDHSSPVASSGSGATHLVRLEHPSGENPLPPPLDGLVDLGSLDDGGAITRLTDRLGSGTARPVVVAWLPTTPDRGVRRRLRDLRTAVPDGLLLVLDGGEDLRRAEPPATVALRLEDWRTLAHELALETIEADLTRLTDANRARLEKVLHRTDDTSTSSMPPVVPLEPGRLDGALAAIGRHLDDPARLASDEGYAEAVRDLAVEFGVAAATSTASNPFSNLADLRDLDATTAMERAGALARVGLDLLPSTLRQGAAWAGLGGLLGATACLAAASIAPAALVALPGWAGTGAGVAGLLSLVRKASPGSTTTESSEPDPSSSNPTIDERLAALATTAVLLWSQGGDEARTTRLLEAVLPDDRLPTLEDGDAGRRWLATIRGRVIAAAAESSP